MATTGIINGHNLRWFLDGTAILQAKTCSISFSKEMRETSSKDSTGSWSTKVGGKKSFSGSCEAYLAEAETFETLWNSFDELSSAVEQITMEFSTDVVGDKFFQCECIITSIEINAENDEEVTYNISFEGTGQPVRSTVA